jgi:PEGA domain
MRILLALRSLPILVALAPAVLPAQPRPSADAGDSASERAREHFSTGVKLYLDGDFDAALVQFQRAYDTKPHFRVLYNISQCNFQLRDYVQARATLSRYLAEGGAGIELERRQQAAAEVGELGRRIARLEVRTNVRGAVVYVDGRKVGTTPLSGAFEVNEGKRLVSVESGAHGSKQRTVSLAGGESQSIAVTFELARRQPHESSATEAPRGAARLASPSHAGVWVAAVSSVLLGSGAGVAGYLALDAEKERRAALNQLGVQPADLEEHTRRTRALALTADLMAAGALVGAGIAATLFFVSESEPRAGLSVGPGRVALRGSF